MGTRFQKPAWYGVVDTQTFLHPPTHPGVKKLHSLTLNTKITTSANYTDGIGTGYTSHDNEMCRHSKDLKTTLKSINQI